jgi:ABC-type sugar transport system ATPase subunit
MQPRQKSHFPEDHRRFGLALYKSVKENTALAHLSIKSRIIDSGVNSMSGESRQEVVLIHWMQKMPEELILEERTRETGIETEYKTLKITGDLV